MKETHFKKLKEQKLKLTPKRQAILDCFIQADTHLSPDQVWGKLKPEAKLPQKLSRIFSSQVFVVLAVLGFLALSVTGALGNAITRGPESEPITSFVYHLFF
jgi:hypothetical protein